MPSPFKPFHEMTPADYAEHGLKVGLEVHQQLLTRRKLFCRCPAGRYTNDYHAEILRHMRPTLSELGEYDGTALMEKKTRKNIYYRIHRDSVCTYEFDDTPPFFIDDEALDIALEICLLLRLNIVGELHIARKQYLDGSIPTGFQRTGILGVDGWIPYKDRKVRIRQLSIEEDACREVSDIGHDRVYRTDRLGMPLIEVVTEPDMHTPEEAAEVGQIIRWLCRSTGKVRTGYGAGRQDVNVSVTGGTRVEVKGTPQIWRNPRLIYNEARRQSSLLRIREELHRRGVTAETLAWSEEDVTRVVSDTTYAPIQAAVADGNVVKCVLLRGFGALLREPTQEHTTLVKEFSDRVRVVACLTKLPNIAHSDAASETLSGREWKDLRRKMRAQHGDALMLVWGSPQDTETACQEIALRAKEATIGIPSDTRQALKDGTNGFERVLPGPDRMYPDTDLPPMAITQTRLDRLAAGLPEFLWDREARYRDWDVPKELVTQLAASQRAGLYEKLVQELRIDAKLAAVVLMQRVKALRRQGLPVDGLPDAVVYEVFKTYKRGGLTRDDVPRALGALARGGALEKDAVERVASVIHAYELQPAGRAELEQALNSALESIGGKTFRDAATKARHVCGRVRHAVDGRVDGWQLATLVRERLPMSETAKRGGGVEGRVARNQ